MNNKIGLIVRREYLERVRKKSFIIVTILMPLFMLLMMAMPALIMMYSSDENKVSVVDDSGVIAPTLKNSDDMTFLISKASLDSARQQDDVDMVLYIPADIVDRGSAAMLFTNGSSSISLESDLNQQISKSVEDIRLRRQGIENLDSIMSQVKYNASVQTFSNNAEDRDKQSSTMISYFVGIVLTLMLYMCLLIYGQMVMTSIIEEKTNRVLEIVVSSVKPAQLMIGKICGIGLVAVTQIIIWGVLLATMSALVLPALVPASMAADVAALNAGMADPAAFTNDMDLVNAMAMLGNAGYIVQIFGLLLLFLIGGFMLYSSIFAAIGSAVDNIQDASQMTSIITIPIILGIIFGMQAASQPSSTLALWMSFIPFTSPMVMMARIPFGVPAWEVVVSLVILVASFFFMVWLAAKIYRVGIFMYGKKPTWGEVIRWVRYK